MSEMNPFASRGERSVSMFAKPLPKPVEAPPEQIEDLEDRFGIQEYLGVEMNYEVRTFFKALVEQIGEEEVRKSILESEYTVFDDEGGIINLDLNSLTSLPEGFTFPEIGGNLDLYSLTSLPEGVTFPEIKRNLDLSSLTSLPEGCTFSEIGGNLNLSSLKSLPEGFTFPEIGGDLYLDSLESIPEEFTFTEVKGNLNLVSLKSLPEGFTFPEIGGYLSLRSLKSLPEGFTFPEIGGNLYLDSLTSGKGVRIPASCRGRVTMNKNALNEIEWI